ncbi:MAG: sigma-70 family RNA polymerase sigma factor [Bryobacteraceae bacterium]|jgi:DNA-directed RNA polymerase specialized sigma24 family protein
MNFDAGFVTRLQQRDPDTCTFLVSSLTPVLESRLRYKLRDPNSIEDVRNEIFCRLLCLVDGGRVREPEQFGSFARGVCDRVAQESRRKNHPTEPLPTAGMEPPDRQPHFDKLLMDRERSVLLWRAMMKLTEADRRLIVELHWEERDRGEMARDRGISVTGLNVRLCRAVKRLRMQILQEPASRGARTYTCRVQTPGDTCFSDRWATMAA